MGLIFRDIQDDQQDAMLDQMHIGITWQLRYLRIKWVLYSILAILVSITATAGIDYLVITSTEYEGIVGFLSHRWFG